MTQGSAGAALFVLGSQGDAGRSRSPVKGPEIAVDSTMPFDHGPTHSNPDAPALRIGIALLLGVGIAMGVLLSMPETVARSVKEITTSQAMLSSPPLVFNPSFECSSASNAAEAMICRNGTLISLDRQMTGLFASLLKSGGSEDWQADQLQWTRQVRDACTTVECLEMAYRTRIGALQIALASVRKISSGDGHAPATRQDLVHVSERAADLAANSGAQDYLYRLCGMTTEADELRGQVRDISALYYEYGKYVLGVELHAFEHAMDNFAAGQRRARAALAEVGASPASACSGDVVRAARARYEVERNEGSYRAQLYIAMAAAIAEAKKTRK